MTTSTKLSVGTLGGPGTFAHQASVHLANMYPEMGELSYFPSMEGVWDAIESGKVDLVVLTEQTSRLGFADADARVATPDSKLWVYAAATVPYGCSLLVKDGTQLKDIDAVYGHGSIRQCRAWLDANLPGIPTAVHEKNSVEAAKEVAQGDGTKAVVGTMITADLTGLVPLAKDIDDGATGSWWALSGKPRYFDNPDRLIVSGRFGGDGLLGDLVTALAGTGFRLTTAYSQTTGKALFEYDYVLGFSGSGRLSDVQRELGNFNTTRLVSAYESRE
jgi:prephenate dehydratase